MAEAGLAPGAVPAPAPDLRAVRWALLLGNFSIGCGVMVTAGALNALVQGLQVSVARAGWLVAAAAVVMALAAPLAAAVVSGTDRRRLLTVALLWFGLGHLASAAAPDYAWLMVLRAVTVLAAAVFTPQAAAAIGVMAAPQQRGQAITFVFLGWSLASVLGMPLHAWIGETLGWRSAFVLVGVLALLAAVGVWRVLPDGVRPPPMSRAGWALALGHPALLAIVGVTVLSAAGQFTLFAYLAAYYKEVLGASAGGVSVMFLCFGAFGVVGNVWVSRNIDRLGAARAVALTLLMMAASLLLWPLGSSLTLMLAVMLPWGLSSFASQSAQQARLSQAAPALTSALVALNSAAMYAGQAIGASSGGELQARLGFGPLNWAALAWMLAAWALSLWASQRLARQPLRWAHG